MRDYSTKSTQSQKSREQNLQNQPFYDGITNEAIQKISEAVTKAKAITLFKTIPYLPEKLQTTRGLAKIIGVSHQTIQNWMKKYSFNFIEEKGGDTT